MTARSFILSGVGISAVLGAGIAGKAVQTPGDVHAANVGQDTGQAAPKLPAVTLAPMPGFADDAAFVAVVSEHVASLEAEAARLDRLVDHAGAVLAAANLVLSRQLEPACSKRLLRIDGHDRPDPRAALDRADALLTRAKRFLDESVDAAEDPSERDAALRKHEALEAFSTGLRAFLLRDPGGDGDGGGIQEAVSRLSPLIEHENPTVSAAARLWQACLRDRDADVDRALNVLDLALRRPKDGSMPYALFAAVERCRLLAMQGGYATALALLMQLEVRCEQWIGETGRDVDAVRLVRLAQMQIMADWSARPMGDADPHPVAQPAQDDDPAAGRAAREADWFSERIGRIAAESFADDDDVGVYRLREAIPIIALPPAAITDREEG